MKANHTLYAYTKWRVWSETATNLFPHHHFCPNKRLWNLVNIKSSLTNIFHFFLCICRRVDERIGMFNGVPHMKSSEPANTNKTDDYINAMLQTPKYLQAPAIFTVALLKKFIIHKFGIDSHKFCVEIMYKVKTIALPDHYTLMDVAYIYTWKRVSLYNIPFPAVKASVISFVFGFSCSILRMPNAIALC